MSLVDLAPELLSQIFSSLHSIADVLNLTQTCKRLHHLLRSTRRLPALFAAAEREFGPLDDIVRLVTWNATQSAWGIVDSQPIVVTYNTELLKQVLQVGRVARKIETLYPAHKWGEHRYLDRRMLTNDEGWRVRRAIYRYWLFCEAFQNRMCTRGSRRLPGIVEERSKLLRGWGSDEIFEIEDVRRILEDIISADLCPTDGRVQRWFNESCDFSDVRWQQRHTVDPFQPKPYIIQNSNWNSWPPDRYNSHSHLQILPSSLFHSHHDEQRTRTRLNVPVPQRRKAEMRGWGDDISQYYMVQSMLKLNPEQVMHLYDTVTTREGIEWYIENEIGGEWFWDNGQTWSDTYNLLLLRRGWDPEKISVAIDNGTAGLVGGCSGEVMPDLSQQFANPVEEEKRDDFLICF